MTAYVTEDEIAPLRKRFHELLDELKGYQDLVSTQRQKVAELEAQIASLTLDRDAAREMLNAEAARYAVEAGEDRTLLLALVARIQRELRR